MSCIINTPFSVLVNGTTSPFFHSERGLQQGCPLSPLLFLLIVEGLSRLIKVEARRGKMQGIKFIEDYILTHILFMDDVLILLNGGIGDLTNIKNIFSLFQVATGMMVNCSKSTSTIAGYTQHEINFALQRFQFTLLKLEDGLRHLGYKLKPLGYKIVDWTCLLTPNPCDWVNICK